MKLIIETDQKLTPVEVSILQALLVGQGQPTAETPPEPAKKTKEPAKEPAKETKEPAELDEAVLGQVIDKATDLINQGKASWVKKALAEVGVPKVGAIETTEQAKRMLELLS